jgi:hypothetical protein
MQTSPTNHPTQRFTTDQALGLKEYHSNRQPDSDTRQLTSLTLTQGKHVVSTMLLDTSPNQLSRFLSCIFFRVNVFISIYFQLVNILF